MKNKKLSAWIATAAMAMTTSISAQNITRLNISPTPVDKNVPVSLQIEFINTGAVPINNHSILKFVSIADSKQQLVKQ